MSHTCDILFTMYNVQLTMYNLPCGGLLTDYRLERSGNSPLTSRS